VDAFVPDFKYGHAACGLRLSGVPDYPSVARAAISAMLAQGYPLLRESLFCQAIFDCCHLPVLDCLASIKNNDLFISVVVSIVLIG